MNNENTFSLLKQLENELTSTENKIADLVKQITKLSNHKESLNNKLTDFLHTNFVSPTNRYKNTMFQKLFIAKSGSDKEEIVSEIRKLIEDNPNKKILIYFDSKDEANNVEYFKITYLNSLLENIDNLSVEELKSLIDFTKYHSAYDLGDTINLIGTNNNLYMFGEYYFELKQVNQITLFDDIPFIEFEYYLYPNNKSNNKKLLKVQYSEELINYLNYGAE